MFDSQSIDITCDNCGHSTPKQIGWIKRHQQFSCSCGTTIYLDSNAFTAELEQIEKRFKKLFD